MKYNNKLAWQHRFEKCYKFLEDTLSQKPHIHK